LKKKDKVFLKVKKPYFQQINLNRKATLMILTLFPACGRQAV
jgi:hypothetical protein